MKRWLVAFSLALAAAGCGAFDDGPVDAAELNDCGCVGDRPIDTPDPNPCASCPSGTVCVQLLGGTCTTLSVTCEPIVNGCDQPVCSPACDQAYCDPGGVSTCNGPSCPAQDLPGALHCYGV